MSEKLWKVNWLSTISGAKGVDDRLMTEEECKKECAKLNDLFPQWRHFPKPSRASAASKGTSQAQE